MRVQNITGRAVDVPGGPSLSPAECGDVESSAEVQACIDAGLIAAREAQVEKRSEGGQMKKRSVVAP